MSNPLSDCSLSLIQNANNQYELTFYANESDILKQIIALIYLKVTHSGSLLVPVAQRSERNAQNLIQEPKYKSRILIKESYSLFSVDCKEVAYFYVQEAQVFLKTKAGIIHKINDRLEEIELELDPHLFFRVNRGVIISYQAVQEVMNYRSGRPFLIASPDFGQPVFISKYRFAAFKKWLDS